MLLPREVASDIFRRLIVLFEQINLKMLALLHATNENDNTVLRMMSLMMCVTHYHKIMIEIIVTI